MVRKWLAGLLAGVLAAGANAAVFAQEPGLQMEYAGQDGQALRSIVRGQVTCTVENAGCYGDAVFYSGLYQGEKLLQVSAMQKKVLFEDGFEQGLGNWQTEAFGQATAPALDSATAHSGKWSYALNQTDERQGIYHTFDTAINGVANIWFYDDVAVKNSASVANITDESGVFAALGVFTGKSVANYASRVGGAWTDTGVPRTTGWHLFTYDASEPGFVTLAIDGQKAGRFSGYNGLKTIHLYDSWVTNPSSKGNGRFDDICVYQKPETTITVPEGGEMNDYSIKTFAWAGKGSLRPVADWAKLDSTPIWAWSDETWNNTQWKEETMVYKETPQIDLNARIIYPEGWAETDKRAVAIFFYGGGWSNFNPDHYESHCKYLASRGMVGIMADYRSIGRDKVSVEALVEDANDIVKWVRENSASLGIDPQRVALGGTSSGGHLAVCTATINTDPASTPNALLLDCPAINTDNTNFRGIFNTPEKVQNLAPMNFLREDMPPMLMTGAGSDGLVPASVLQPFYEAYVKKTDEKVTYIMYPGVGHSGTIYKKCVENGNMEPHYKALEDMDAFLTAIGFLNSAEQ